MITSVTWAGYEFLDAARSDTVWNRAKSAVITGAGGLAFDVLKAVLIKVGVDQAMQALK